MEYDLLFPDRKLEARKHKKKTLIQGPKSFFIDIKDPISGEIVHTFSHANCVIKTKSGTILAVPTGGKLKLMDGVKIRRKAE